MIGNNRSYKRIKTEINPETNERNIKVEDIRIIDRKALREGLNQKRGK
ncbi:MAG: hypothetical protein ACFFDY_00200 [Candidatus Thorarchaeota archaeon]